MFHAWNTLKDLPETIITSEIEEEVVYTAQDKEPFEIRKEGEVFIIEGSWARKIVASTNFTDYESTQYFQRALKRKGVIDELERMGINEGDTVQIFGAEFDYVR
jgi:GTPase